jgi:hypothetical protein
MHVSFFPTFSPFPLNSYFVFSTYCVDLKVQIAKKTWKRPSCVSIGGIPMLSIQRGFAHVVDSAVASAVVLLVLALFAFPQSVRADLVFDSPGDPEDCGLTAFGILCANVSFTRPATRSGFAFVHLTSFPNAVIEDTISMTTTPPNLGPASALDTRAQFKLGDIGSDVSIPHAFWLTPEAWCWGPNCNGGAFAFFNSIGLFHGKRTAFANALIIGDPFNAVMEIEALDKVLGGTGILPTPVFLSTDPTTKGGINIPSANFGVPEPNSLLLLGTCLLSAFFLIRRKSTRASQSDVGH